MPRTIWNCVTNLELAVEWASKRTHVILFMTDTNIKKLKCSAVPRFSSHVKEYPRATPET